MSEILKEYDVKKSKWSYFFKSFFRYIIAIICVAILAIHVGNIMFGKRSLDVMLSLQSQKERLSEDVEILKKRNAWLQKEYFELKELEPDTTKK
ncbi:septum formation initiator [Campylobacter sp. faydin G-24]|uniref:Septum formation initiator n=1 Tax=Campylobacter anatolicus TaxID=2829105 RepID=A0ABS5HH00_9BACT|nr:septum formation initiator [Campylobacter anatolicus]MBR8462225.1 septum formation initiator [Campylobacter anatolicus]MBR8463321.1 septum formation initiator [Campylobacter anatolicus]MBR8465365.1 septum formation initiator [Campylobacter anatolicus]